MDSLERRIIEAEERGDRALLEKLQDQYRREVSSGRRSVVRVTDAAGVIRIGSTPAGAAPPTPRATRAPTSTPTAPVRSTLPAAVYIRAALKDGLRRAAVWDGLERGGWLLGRYRGSGIEITYTTDFFDSDRTSTGVWVDVDQLLRLERDFGPDTFPVGDWHIQPDTAYPSEGDKKGWRAATRLYGRSWIGLIYTPRSDAEIARYPELEGYPSPSAWVTSDGRTERIDIVEVES
jgi:hypothetical protein